MERDFNENINEPDEDKDAPDVNYNVTNNDPDESGEENKAPGGVLNSSDESEPPADNFGVNDGNLTQDGDYGWISYDYKASESTPEESAPEEGAPNPTGENDAGGYSYYEYNEEPSSEANFPEEPEKKKTRRKKEKKSVSTFGKLVRVVAFALVFGLIAGSVFYGVNYLGNKYIAPTNGTVTAVTPDLGNVNTTTITASDINTGTAVEGSVAEVAAKCLPSLVTISEITIIESQNIFGQKQQYESEGAGSGVIVGMNDTELLIATNNHVVSDATTLEVGFIDETTAGALIKGTDEDNDLAVIAVKLEDISAETLENISIAALGDSDELVLGEQVVAIGNALGYGQSVTSGVVSALGREGTFSDGSGYIVSTDLIQTDAPINSGNSGGGLFNMKGELIGINEAKASMTSSGVTVDGIGFAISITKAEPILRELMELETKEVIAESERGYLGVTCASVTEDIAESFNMPIGVCFTKVLDGSPAANAGLKKGDVLTSINGHTVETYEDLVEYLSYCRAGEEVEVVVMRANAGEYLEIKATVTLGSQEVISNLE